MGKEANISEPCNKENTNKSHLQSTRMWRHFHWRLLQKYLSQIKCNIIKLGHDFCNLAAVSFDPLIYAPGECSLADLHACIH
jgi:hypothetical protein